MTDRITLTGLKAFGYHGVFEQEKNLGQEFIVDVVIHTSFDSAIQTDDVSSTIDYGYVAELVHRVVVETRYDLIESLADDIARQICDLAGVQQVFVTVHKPQAPITVSFVDVSVTRVLP